MLRRVVIMGSKRPHGFVDRETFDAIGAGADPGAVQHAVERMGLGDLAIILYTSGTTAHPRGVMLTHEAFVAPG